MIGRHIAVAALLGSAALLIQSPASGQWVADGAVMSAAPGSQESPLIVSDGAAGALVVWTDFRHGPREYYGQRVGGDGAIPPGWAADGVAIFTAGGAPTGMVAAPDGAGGVLIAWKDTREVPGGRIYAQRLTASGAIAPQWPAGAVQVSVSSSGRFVKEPAIVPDGSGAIVIYGSYFVVCTPRGACTITEPQILAQRVGPSGTIDPPWSDGEVVLDAAGTALPVAVPDGSGGAIAAWIREAGAGNQIRIQRVTAGGVIAAGWPDDGLVIGSTPCGKSGVRMIADGVGGAIVSWLCPGASTSLDVYATRVGATGTVATGWPAEGVPVCAAPGDQVAADLVSDGAGGALLYWEDGRSGDEDIYALHLTATGLAATDWAADGVRLCGAMGDQIAPAGAPDGLGGAYVAWSDLRAGGVTDLYASHVGPGGALAAGWPANGQPVSSAELDQGHPVAISDGAGGAIVAWQDSRSGLPCGGVACSDIYAQRLVTDGTVAVVATLVASEVEPGAVRLIWSVEGASAGFVGIERAENEGDWTSLATALPDGTGRLEFEDLAVTAGHRYGYRLVLPDRAGPRLAGEVWIVVPARPGLALFSPRPNPASGELTVTFSLPGEGDARLDLLDVSGRRLRSIRVGGLGPGLHSVDLGWLSGLPDGVYLVRLTRGPRTITTRAVFLR